MVKPFDDALFGMKVGEIVGPVETQYGYHIIKLDAIKGGEGPKFEAVKPKIEEEVQEGQGRQALRGGRGELQQHRLRAAG